MKEIQTILDNYMKNYHAHLVPDPKKKSPPVKAIHIKSESKEGEILSKGVIEQVENYASQSSDQLLRHMQIDRNFVGKTCKALIKKLNQSKKKVIHFEELDRKHKESGAI